MKHLLILLLTCSPLVALAGPGDCDRSCLKSALGKYLGAVLRHDPEAAPLAVGYRHTENAINVRLGSGVWKSVTALGAVQRQFFDPVSSQAAYYGIMDEGPKAAIVTVRIKVEDHAITEGEWYIARDGDPGLPGATPPNAWNPTSLAQSAPPERKLPTTGRLPRARMLAIVDSYFDGITSHDGSVVLAHPGCNRYENGTRVTVNHDCVSGLSNFNLANVGGRRVDFVDEEAGVVMAMAVFIRRGGSPVPRNAFSEWFFIDGGKIRNIWTAMYYPGAERPVPNWPPFEGNFPLPTPAPPSSTQ